MLTHPHQQHTATAALWALRWAVTAPSLAHNWPLLTHYIGDGLQSSEESTSLSSDIKLELNYYKL